MYICILSSYVPTLCLSHSFSVCVCVFLLLLLIVRKSTYPTYRYTRILYMCWRWEFPRNTFFNLENWLCSGAWDINALNATCDVRIYLYVNTFSLCRHRCEICQLQDIGAVLCGRIRHPADVVRTSCLLLFFFASFSTLPHQQKKNLIYYIK